MVDEVVNEGVLAAAAGALPSKTASITTWTAAVSPRWANAFRTRLIGLSASLPPRWCLLVTGPMPTGRPTVQSIDDRCRDDGDLFHPKQPGDEQIDHRKDCLLYTSRCV